MSSDELYDVPKEMTYFLGAKLGKDDRSYQAGIKFDLSTNAMTYECYVYFPWNTENFHKVFETYEELKQFWETL